MLSIVISVIALGVLITIHELGHYLAAKACGVAVIEFSIGMGPRIFSIVKGNTRYSLRILPFGGSCMMLGEELEEETGKAVGEAAGSVSESAESQESTEYRSEEAEGHGAILIDERSYRASEQFVNKPAWSRFIIIAAGPVFNFVLAFGLSLIITGTVGFDKPVITAVTPNMPAAEAGIEAGDMIYAMSAGGDRVVIETARDINLFTALHR
ncbi:MAG: site-2 protease family protein, partial [Clostridiales bacterium]|nr:site-2 protease family protein [Clostridiales bacterium]